MRVPLARLAHRSWSSYRRYWGQTLSRLLFVAVGVAAVVGSVEFAAASRERVRRQLERLGANLLIVLPQPSVRIAGRARTGRVVTTLSRRDRIALERSLPGVVASSAVFSAAYPVKAGDAYKASTTVVGCDPAYGAMRGWGMGAGSWLSQDDLRANRRVAILGARLARDLFGGQPPTGSRVHINRIDFVVRGVLGEQGQGRDPANEDEQIFVPVTTATRRLGNADYFTALVFAIRAPDLASAFARAGEMMGQLHPKPRGRSDDYQIQSASAIVEAKTAADRRLRLILQLAGASSLVLLAGGALCLSWLSVMQRMPEWGTLRLLGATSGDIVLQIAGEFALVALAGSGLGAAAGWAVGRLLAVDKGLHPATEFRSTVAAFAVGLGVNLVFAAAPAWRTVRLQPSEVLRR